MSQATVNTSVTETTLVTCDPEQGLPVKIEAGDGQTVHLCYYPASPTAGHADRSDHVPAVKELITGLTLENTAATPLSDAMALTCPVIHDTTLPPLMAQYQFLAFSDGSVSEATLTLYGYATATKDQAGILTPDTVLTLEGVVVDTTTVPWTVTKGTKRKGLSVDLQQIERKKAPGVLTTVTTATVWYKDNGARQTRKLEETLTSDEATRMLRAKSETTVKLEKNELTPVLSQHIRSARSGRIVRETQQDGLGRPETMLYHTYDARDRRLGSTSYPYDETHFSSGSTPEEGQVEETVKWRDTHNGTWVSTTGPDGRWGRVLLDGLQRPVRWELQRTPGTDDADSNYVCLQEMSYGADGEVTQQCVYDYFPGGLCLRNDGIALPDNLRDWFWHAENATHKTDAEQGDSLITETMTGTLLKGPQHAVETMQRNHGDGQVTLKQTHKRWDAGSGKLKDSGVSVEERINAKGQRILLTETLPERKGVFELKWETVYDELGRRTQINAPDGRVVQWAYQGLSTTPTQISVKGKDGKETVVGKQTLRSAGNSGDKVETRTVGASGSSLTFKFDDDGHVRPDNTRLYRERSVDGNTVSWYAEKKPEPKAQLVKFEYNAVTQAIRTERSATEDNLQSVISSTHSSPQLLGLYLIDRVVRGVKQERRSLHSLRGETAGGLHPNAVFSRAWGDSQNRRNRVRRGHFEYRYRYGAQGECESIAVEDMRTGHKQTVAYRYDESGREVERTYHLDGLIKSRYVQTWTAIGQLSSKVWYRNGASDPSRTENFTYYRKRDELIGWTVKADKDYEIRNARGDALNKQTYTYDALGNVLTCTTTFSNEETEKRSYGYEDAAHPTRRTSVSVTRTAKGGTAGTPTKLQLSYDDNGNLKTSEHQQTLTYTHTGQLQSVKATGSAAALTTYEYDEQGRLAAQWDEANKQRRVLQYSDHQLCGEVWLDEKGNAVKRRVLDEEAGLVVQVRKGQGTSETAQTLFILPDPQNGGGEEFWLDDKGEWANRSIGFTPWGEACLEGLNAMNSGLGYNGQRVDPVTGSYHPGHGYRVYDPQHQAFYQGDSLSPFGEGGLNDRAYCAGRNPVNWHDPSGHIMLSRREEYQSLASLDDMIRDTAPPQHEPAAWWEWWLLVVGFAASIAFAIMTGGVGGALMLAVGMAAFGLGATALALKQSNPLLSDKLGWAAFGLGIGEAVGGLVKVGVGILAKSLRAGLQGLSNLRNVVKLHGVGGLFKASRGERYLSPSVNLRNGLSASRPMSTKVTRVMERANPNLTGNAWTQYDLGHGPAFELYATPGANRLVIDAHGLPVKGLSFKGSAVPEHFSASNVKKFGFYADQGFKIDMQGHNYDDVMRGVFTPKNNYPGGKVPNYLLSEFTTAEHIKELDKFGKIPNFDAGKTFGLAANSAGVDFLKPLQHVTLEQIMTKLASDGYHYDVVDGLFCRGSFSRLDMPGFAKAGLHEVFKSFDRFKGIRMIP